MTVYLCEILQLALGWRTSFPNSVLQAHENVNRNMCISLPQKVLPFLHHLCKWIWNLTFILVYTIIRNKHVIFSDQFLFFYNVNHNNIKYWLRTLALETVLLTCHVKYYILSSTRHAFYPFPCFVTCIVQLYQVAAARKLELTLALLHFAARLKTTLWRSFNESLKRGNKTPLERWVGLLATNNVSLGQNACFYRVRHEGQMNPKLYLRNMANCLSSSKLDSFRSLKACLTSTGTRQNCKKATILLEIDLRKCHKGFHYAARFQTIVSYIWDNCCY